MAIRLTLLGHHYREDWDWTDGQLAEAEQRLARWRWAAGLPAGPDAAPLVQDVRRLLADDLNAPGALAAIDAWISRAQAGDGGDPEAPARFRILVDALLGIAL
jgi:L-cysteine:1D-myo-inositol 2-amino-2-deoxy-alpha-D-glucopyranoside ligase